jgi:2-keto-4-pentenoate hydratase/2-oxohepta-3-ene-1,7-dioic acid hydratase in catechol pathway
MRRFRDFLKINEAGAGPVAPTMTAGTNWKFPNSQWYQSPKTFSQLVQHQQYLEKPGLQTLQKAQYLVQNIASDKSLYEMNPGDIMISGTPQNGGMISGITYNKIISAGASRGLKFLPAEFKYLEDNNIFLEKNGVVSINLGNLYKMLETELKNDNYKNKMAHAADNTINQLTPFITGMSSPNGSQPLLNKQYGA